MKCGLNSALATFSLNCFAFSHSAKTFSFYSHIGESLGFFPLEFILSCCSLCFIYYTSSHIVSPWTGFICMLQIHLSPDLPWGDDGQLSSLFSVTLHLSALHSHRKGKGNNGWEPRSWVPGSYKQQQEIVLGLQFYSASIHFYHCYLEIQNPFSAIAVAL